jgi:hypothetical protein
LNHPAAASELPDVSRNLIARRAGVLAATVTAAVLTTGGPALADVAVEPPSAVQGEGANVHFTVTNTGTSPITRVKLMLPADNPVAEVFPLSVDDWAPQITPLTLTTPLTGTHGGSPVTETASAITWIAVGGDLAPGESADLPVAMGPLPATSSMTFTLQATYAGGRPGPALPPAVLTLTPGTGAAGGHTTTHGGGAAPADIDPATFAALVEQSDGGPGAWSIAGWVLAGLAAAAAGVVLYRGRHRAEPTEDDDEPQKDEPKEPVGAGAARVTSWSYRDGPG